MSDLFVAVSVVLLVTSVLASPSPSGIVAGAGLAALALCAAFDLVELRVPNHLTYSGTTLVLVTAIVKGHGAGIDAAAGALVGGGFLLAISLISRGRVGMGDAKLSALGAGLVGVNFVLVALFAGALAAAIVYLSLLSMGRITRTQPLPFAPFLAGGYIVVALVTGTTLAI
jgi:prepilin signal peptidase PulO-like enzyme (type II secretory pathway)